MRSAPEYAIPGAEYFSSAAFIMQVSWHWEASAMATGKVEICGVDTSTLPVITNERMRELFPLVHSGDMAAR